MCRRRAPWPWSTRLSSRPCWDGRAGWEGPVRPPIMNQPVLSFRSSFWVGWRWVTSFVGTLKLATIGVAYLSGWETLLPSPLVPVVFVLAAGLGIAIAVWYHPVYVAAEDLKCYDGILTFAIEPPGGTRGVMGMILRR